MIFLCLSKGPEECRGREGWWKRRGWGEPFLSPIRRGNPLARAARRDVDVQEVEDVPVHQLPHPRADPGQPRPGREVPRLRPVRWAPPFPTPKPRCSTVVSVRGVGGGSFHTFLHIDSFLFEIFFGHLHCTQNFCCLPIRSSQSLTLNIARCRCGSIFGTTDNIFLCASTLSTICAMKPVPVSYTLMPFILWKIITNIKITSRCKAMAMAETLVVLRLLYI